MISPSEADTLFIYEDVKPTLLGSHLSCAALLHLPSRLIGGMRHAAGVNSRYERGLYICCQSGVRLRVREANARNRLQIRTGVVCHSCVSGKGDGMAILELDGLTKIFGSRPEAALDLVDRRLTREEIREKTGQTVGIGDVSFEVEEGEILVVMGLSGSGKSTLIRCVNRLIEPTGGSVYVDDEDITEMSGKELRSLRRHKLAMVFQHFALMPHRTVIGNAEYGLEVMGVDAEERRREAMEALELVGLDGWETEYPGQLSGGMKQRVGLARALAVDPEIVLMDEALSALDPLIRTDMQNELIALQRQLGKTMLFITHDLDEAINMGDRIVLLKDGYVVQVGTAEEILSNPATKYVEQFVAEVDVSKVRTAETVMKEVHDVAHVGDGPRAMMRKMEKAGFSSIFVVDTQGKLIGLARAGRVRDVLEKDHKDYGDLIEEDVRSVRLDTPLEEITPRMKETRDPIAVIDEEGKLHGVVLIGELLAGLTERGEADKEGLTQQTEPQGSE